MKRSRRERLLINLLPAAMVLALYAFLFAMPAQRRLQKTRNELSSQRDSAITVSAAEQSKQNVKLAQAGLSKLNDQTRRDRAQIEYLGLQWSNGQARLTTVQQVTELLQQFNLSIVSQEFEQDPKISNYLRDLESIIAKHSDDGESLEYWQLELTGGYPDMMKFLGQVKTSGMRTFPVTLMMDASTNNDGIHSWTVVFII